MFGILILSAPTKSWSTVNHTKYQDHVPSSRLSKIVVSSREWGDMDFRVIPRHFSAHKLKDDHLRAMLTIINPRKVKKIILDNCIYLNGSGLEPLRKSTELKLIDLSCQGSFTCDPSLSQAIVVPILSSILDQDDNSLKYIKFYDKWSYSNRRSEELKQFHTTYESKLKNQSFSCSKCSKVCRGHDICKGRRGVGGNSVCYECLLDYCDDCEEDMNDSERKKHPLCSNCVECEKCKGAKTKRKCGKIMSCPECKRAQGNICVKYLQCEDCGKEHCERCRWKMGDSYDGEVYYPHDVYKCEVCGKSYCLECRYSRCSDKSKVTICAGCARVIFDSYSDR